MSTLLLGSSPIFSTKFLKSLTQPIPAIIPLLVLIAIQAKLFQLSYDRSLGPVKIHWPTSLSREFEVPPSYVHPLARPTPSQEAIDNMLISYANYYDVDHTLLRHIAFCESRFDPKATNSIYAGMYQFNTTTWIATRERMNADPNPELRFDAEEAIRTAAFKIGNGGVNAWKYCSRSLVSRS